MDDDSMISVPFASQRETQTGARYHWRCDNRGSDLFVIFQYTLSGHGCFEMAGRVHDVPPGHAFIALVPERASYFHPARNREPWEFCWLNFYGSLAIRLWSGLRTHFGPVIELTPEVTAEFRRLVKRGEKREFIDHHEASIECYAFFMRCSRALTEPNATGLNAVSATIRFCQSHYRDPLSIKELAERCRMSREHLSRVFKARVGMPPAAYLRKQRLTVAAQLLKESSLPLREIAMRSGFYSGRHLMKAFRASYGMTPEQFRVASARSGKPR